MFGLQCRDFAENSSLGKHRKRSLSNRLIDRESKLLPLFLSHGVERQHREYRCVKFSYFPTFASQSLQLRALMNDGPTSILQHCCCSCYCTMHQTACYWSAASVQRHTGHVLTGG